MSKLILPDSEPTTAQLILPTRRGFMKTLSAAFTGLVVAPAIVPAANLMQIHSPENRLVVGFYQRWSGSPNMLFPSFLNLTDWTEDSFRAWEVIQYNNVYSLVRQAEIYPDYTDRYGGMDKSYAKGTPFEVAERKRVDRAWVEKSVKKFQEDEIARGQYERRAALYGGKKNVWTNYPTP